MLPGPFLMEVPRLQGLSGIGSNVIGPGPSSSFPFTARIRGLQKSTSIRRIFAKSTAPRLVCTSKVSTHAAVGFTRTTSDRRGGFWTGSSAPTQFWSLVSKPFFSSAPGVIIALIPRQHWWEGVPGFVGSGHGADMIALRGNRRGTKRDRELAPDPFKPW